MIKGILQLANPYLEIEQDLDFLDRYPEAPVWIDIENQNKKDFKFLIDKFKVHHLAIEDCEHLNQRPKIDQYLEHIFLVLHSFTPLSERGDISFVELHIFFNRNYLITVHQKEIPSLSNFWEQVVNNVSIIKESMDFLLYSLCERVVDSHFPLIDNINDVIDTIEDTVIYRHSSFNLKILNHIKRSITTMRGMLSHQREIFYILAQANNNFIKKENTLYFTDLYDHSIRLQESINVCRDLITNVRDVHFSILSQRTNEIMKRLTMLSIVFLPLSFVTGFFGMNFEQIAFKNNYLFCMVVIFILVLPIILVFWFWKKKWFS